jgi:glutathione S-transferase
MIALHHGGPAGHSAAVLIALAEKGLEADERAIDLAAYGQLGPEFLALSPAGQVPVLEFGGHTLSESFFILLWLDESFPDPPLGGADPVARYRVQKWGKYVETHIAPYLAVWRWVRLGGEVPRDALQRLPVERRALWERAAAGFGGEEAVRAEAALLRACERLAADLAGGWLAGSEYTFADIAAYPHVAQFDALGIDVPLPVEDWLARVAERPAVHHAAAEMQVIATMGPELSRWG